MSFTPLMSFTYFTPCSHVSIVNFEQVNADWVPAAKYNFINPFLAGVSFHRVTKGFLILSGSIQIELKPEASLKIVHRK